MNVLRTLVTFLAFVACSFLNPLVFLLDPSRRLLVRVLNWEGVVGFALLGLEVRLVEDRFSPARLPGRRYLFVANHQSMLDIAAVYRFCPVPVGFVAKESLFGVPFLNLMLWSTGAVKIHRRNLRKASGDLRRAVEVLRRSRSLLIFPEGTRYEGDDVGPFKPGFLRLAREAGVEVVPVAIRGTGLAFPRGAVVVDSSRPVTVAFGAPFSVSALPSEPMAAAEAVRGMVKEAYDRMRF